MAQRQVHSAGFTAPGAVLGHGSLHARCGASTSAWFDGAENCGSPAVAVLRLPSTSLRAAEVPHGPDCSADHRVHPVAVRFLVVDPCCVGRADSPVPPWRRRSRSHSCSSSTGALWFRLQKTAEIPQLLFIVGRRFYCRGAEAATHGLAVQKTMEAGQDIFNCPLYLAITCTVFGVRLWSTGFWTFLGVHFRNGIRMQHSLVRQWIYVWRQSTRPFGRISRVLYVEVAGPVAGSMVQTVRRTMDIPQLLTTVAHVPVVRSYRSLTYLSWLGCRFPWSCSHRDSPVSVH